MKQSKYSLLNTADEKLGWAAEMMMGMQKDADGTPEIIADYAWLRDDEIEGEAAPDEMDEDDGGSGNLDEFLL